MAQAEEKQELSAGAGCLVLAFTLAWVVIPMVALTPWLEDYFARAEDWVQFAARLLAVLPVMAIWGVIGSRIVEGVYKAHRDLHGERLRIVLFRLQPKTCLYLIPSGLTMTAPRVADLRRGERVPSDFTKAGKAMSAGVLNVSNVDRVIFNPNLVAMFKDPPTRQDLRMVDLAIADALWVHGGKPVTFSLQPLDHSE